MNLYNAFQLQRKPPKAGRKLTSIITRTAVWESWHSNCTFSTITSRPAKLRVSDKSHIQSGLDFIDAVSIISQRNRNFYESNWMINTKTYKQIYVDYLAPNNDKHVSIGTFMTFKPFYIWGATTNRIEMCCCKKHLHACWAINALIDCAKAQNFDLDSYESSLKAMTHFLNI